MILTSQQIIFLTFILSITTGVVSGVCPETHPYPYNNGSDCCSVPEESSDIAIGCEGGFLRFDSTCCNGTTLACPNDPCLRAQGCYAEDMSAGNTPAAAPTVTASSPEECQLLCQREPNCLYFVFNSNNGNCRFRRFVNPTPNQNQILGPKFCGVDSPTPTQSLPPCYFPNTGAGSNGNVAVIRNITSPEICQQICQLSEDCFYFVYVPDVQICRLKPMTSSEDMVFNPSSILGPKYCPGEEPATASPVNETTPSPGDGCPDSHPFPYLDGSFCCSTNIENVNLPEGDLCDGGELTLASRCCRGNDFVPCPEGPLSCGTVGDTCPFSYPFPYLNGNYCCRFQREFIFAPDGEACDGSLISLESSCCQDNDFIECPVQSCLTINPDIGSDDACPLSHPYPYLGGAYCCRTGQEKVDAADGEACDGGVISLASTCCENDDFLQCPLDSCLTVNPGGRK